MRQKYPEVSIGCSNFSSYVFSQFGYKPSCSFLLLPLCLSGIQPLKLSCKFNACLQSHTSVKTCVLIWDLAAHPIVCTLPSLKAGSMYFSVLWVRELLLLHPVMLLVLEAQGVPFWPDPVLKGWLIPHVYIWCQVQISKLWDILRYR